MECSKCKIEMAGVGYGLTLCPLHASAENLRDALEKIRDHPHCSYENNSVDVADGHRCAANIARAALTAVKGEAK